MVDPHGRAARLNSYCDYFEILPPDDCLQEDAR